MRVIHKSRIKVNKNQNNGRMADMNIRNMSFLFCFLNLWLTHRRYFWIPVTAKKKHATHLCNQDLQLQQNWYSLGLWAQIRPGMCTVFLFFFKNRQPWKTNKQKNKEKKPRLLVWLFPEVFVETGLTGGRDFCIKQGLHLT